MKSRLMDDVKVALKEGDKKRVGILRLMVSELKRKEIDSQKELTDADSIAVLEKMAKQRQESMQHFAAAKREDLFEQERYEQEVILSYLPPPLGEEELAALIDQAFSQTGASEMKDMGKVIGWVKSNAKGRIDMGAVSGLVKQRLSS